MRRRAAPAGLQLVFAACRRQSLVLQYVSNVQPSPRSLSSPLVPLPPLLPPLTLLTTTTATKRATCLQALKFAIDQAPFACGPSCAAPPVANPDNDTTITTATTGFDSAGPVHNLEVLGTSGLPQAALPPPPLRPTAASGLQKEASAAEGTCQVRLAVRAAVQFACNYCVGSHENQALLWKAWFPRGLMVRGVFFFSGGGVVGAEWSLFVRLCFCVFALLPSHRKTVLGIQCAFVFVVIFRFRFFLLFRGYMRVRWCLFVCSSVRLDVRVFVQFC